MTNYMLKKIKNIAKKGRIGIIHKALQTENDLEKICKKVWVFSNPKNQQYLFAKYVNPNDKSDTTIVTLGYYDKNCQSFRYC